MIILSSQHLLDPVRYIASPNANERPAGVAVSLIVIHGISLPPGQYGNGAIEALFTNQLDPNKHPDFKKIATLKVSAHLVIERDGKITQFVPFDKRAWHAGDSSYQDRSGCNDFSIGIELEGCDTEPYTEVQYRELAIVTRLLLSRYPTLSAQRIVGHSDIAPERKTDPGPNFLKNFLEIW